MPPIGNLGNLDVGLSGSAALHAYSKILKVSDIIGRSVVVSGRDGERYLTTSLPEMNWYYVG